MEYRDSSVANMDMDDSKIGYKRLLMDTNKLPFSVYSLKQNPFRVATTCLVVLCVFLVAALIGQSVSYRNVQQENANKLQALSANKDDLQTSLANVQKEKGRAEKRQGELEQSVETLQRRRSQMQTAYTELAEEMRKTRDSERTLKSSNAALTKELQELNGTVSSLQKNNNALLTAKDMLQVELNQAAKLKTTLDANYKTLRAEKNNLQNSFNNVSRFKDQLQLSYNTLMTQVESLEKRLHLTTTEKDKAKTSQMNATTAKDALQDMYNMLVQATEQLNSSYNNMLREKQELEKSCGSIRAERDSLVEKNGNLTAERDQLQVEVTRLNTTIAAKKCPSGWQPYMFSCYYSSSTKRNWKSSRDFCKSKGADLAIITSQEEMTFINGLYASDKEVWIGLTDEGIEGHWVWVDGTPLSPNATFWASGQPNSYSSRNQDCAEFWHRASGHGEWNDEGCSNEQYWICEL